MGNRSWSFQECGAKCGKKLPWNRLRLVKTPENRAFFVCDECEDVFRREVDAFDKLKRLAAMDRDEPFWRRWRHARLFYALQIVIGSRLSGFNKAKRAALWATWMFCMPAWLVTFPDRVRMWIAPNEGHTGSPV